MVKTIKRTLALLLLMITVCSCHVFRYFYWNISDINDHNKFSSVPVSRSGPVFEFSRAAHPAKLALPSSMHQRYQGIMQLFEKNHTVAFLVIRHDSIIFEAFFRGYDKTSIIPSFSISKAVVSALTGIATGEGIIQGTGQVVTDFLPFMKQPGFEKISIEDLLNMRAGLHFSERYATPFSLTPKFYYGRNLKKYMSKLKTEEPPGLRYRYQSASTEILGMILEKASGRPLNEYLREKIWAPLGMESDASWSIDSRKHHTIKSFCCLNAVAYDYARFGRLYLRHGNWQGRQIIPEAWVKKSFTVINDSKDSQGYAYTYCWRVMPSGAIFAKGILGQYIYVNREKDLVIVRLGSKAGKIHWARLFDEIAGQL